MATYTEYAIRRKSGEVLAKVFVDEKTGETVILPMSSHYPKKIIKGKMGLIREITKYFINDTIRKEGKTVDPFIRYKIGPQIFYNSIKRLNQRIRCYPIMAIDHEGEFWQVIGHVEIRPSLIKKDSKFPRVHIAIYTRQSPVDLHGQTMWSADYTYPDLAQKLIGFMMGIKPYELDEPQKVEYSN